MVSHLAPNQALGSARKPGAPLAMRSSGSMQSGCASFDSLAVPCALASHVQFTIRRMQTTPRLDFLSPSHRHRRQLPLQAHACRGWWTCSALAGIAGQEPGMTPTSCTCFVRTGIVPVRCSALAAHAAHRCTHLQRWVLLSRCPRTSGILHRCSLAVGRSASAGAGHQPSSVSSRHAHAPCIARLQADDQKELMRLLEENNRLRKVRRAHGNIHASIRSAHGSVRVVSLLWLTSSVS